LYVRFFLNSKDHGPFRVLAPLSIPYWYCGWVYFGAC